MRTATKRPRTVFSLPATSLAAVLLTLLSGPASAGLVLGPEELVQAGGVNIIVPGYSVPSFVYWDGDNLKDLVIGEGGGGVSAGKVRVYLNVGSESDPQFAGYFYAQSGASDLIVPGSG
jgi:hypothetical protein